ncbi:MAG: response regulator transcription factor [Chloroflexota bacterium]|nr:MAG: response regulator transcription factor [Chloroflexota bacterium]
MSNSIRIVVADDHAIVREGIRLILQSQSDLEVVGEAATGREAIDLVAQHRPDLVLMDLAMPDLNGMEATLAIKSQHPEVQVLVLTMHDSQEQFYKMLQAGASGYVLKGSNKNDLLGAIRVVAEGGVFLHPMLANRLIRDYLHRAGSDGAPSDQLTEREETVLRLIAEGHTSREIAETLVISPSTVERHRASIMSKLGLHSRADLVKYAIRHGIVEA